MKKLLHFSPRSSNQEKWVNHLFGYLKVLCFVVFILVSSTSSAQTFPPASSCTSKDLELVSATLPYVKCETCTPGTTITKPLTLGIINKTGSTRTSFAFWAILTIYNSNGTIASSTAVSGCYGPIPKSATTPFSFGNVSYACGQSIAFTNI